MSSRLWLIAVNTVFVVVPARAADKQELARLCTANTAAVQAIRTLRCQVTIDDKSEEWGIPGGDYWRSGTSIRMHWTQRGMPYWAVIHAGIVKCLVRQDISSSPGMMQLHHVKESLTEGKFYWHGAIEKHNGGSQYSFDPWLQANCTMSDGGIAGNVSFEQFARNHQKELRSIRKLTQDGVETIAVEFQLPHALCTTHLDPAANYMIRKTGAHSNSSDGYHSYTEVLRFREAVPGIYFPEQVVIKRWNAGKAMPDEIVTFNVVINRPIPASTFDLKFRNGIHIANRIEGTKYRVNQDGIPTGPKTPLNAVVAVPAEPKDMGTPLTETREEPRAWGWWILPASLTLLLATVAVIFARRWRVAAAE